MTLTHDNRVRIQIEVQTGQLPKQDESSEEYNYRIEMMRALAKGNRQGSMLEFTNDWDVTDSNDQEDWMDDDNDDPDTDDSDFEDWDKEDEPEDSDLEDEEEASADDWQDDWNEDDDAQFAELFGTQHSEEEYPTHEHVRSALRTGKLKGHSYKSIFRPVGSTQAIVQIHGHHFTIDDSSRLIKQACMKHEGGRCASQLKGNKTQRQVTEYFNKFPKLTKEDFASQHEEDSLQFDADKSDLQKLRDFLEQGREAAIKRVALTAKRIRGLKDLNTDLTALAGIVEQEIFGLRPLLEEQLISNMFGGAVLGISQTAAHVPKFAGPFAYDPSISTDTLASLLFPGAEAPRAVFPVLNAAVGALRNAGPLAGDNYKHTAQLVRNGAFAVTGDLTESAVKDIRDTLNKALAEGRSQKEFIDEIATRLEDVGSPLSPNHLETIFRTNTMTAMSNAQNAAVQHPMVVDAFPYAAYSATHDGRVRKEHLALEKRGLDGTNIYRINDPVFQKFRPPWDYSCRCTWTPTSVEMAAHKGVYEASSWMERAAELAKEQGGSVYQYLGEATPPTQQFVSEPEFQPPPEFQNAQMQEIQMPVIIPREQWALRTTRPQQLQEQPQKRQQPSSPASAIGELVGMAFQEVIEGLGTAIGDSLGNSLGNTMGRTFSEGLTKMPQTVVNVQNNNPIQLAELQPPQIIVNVEPTPITVNNNLPQQPAPNVVVNPPEINVTVQSPKQQEYKLVHEYNEDGQVVSTRKVPIT